jgi:hypothetical protein
MIAVAALPSTALGTRVVPVVGVLVSKVSGGRREDVGEPIVVGEGLIVVVVAVTDGIVVVELTVVVVVESTVVVVVVVVMIVVTVVVGSATVVDGDSGASQLSCGSPAGGQGSGVGTSVVSCVSVVGGVTGSDAWAETTAGHAAMATAAADSTASCRRPGTWGSITMLNSCPSAPTSPTSSTTLDRGRT